MYDNVDPLPVKVQSSTTEKVIAYTGLACAVAGLAYSVYSLFTADERQEEIHEFEKMAAENYEKQTSRQAETAEIENLVAREKAARELGKSLEELEAMLRGDPEAIARNLPETEVAEEAAEATA